MSLRKKIQDSYIQRSDYEEDYLDDIGLDYLAKVYEKNKSVDAEQFWNFYESKRRYVGKNKMKSWHSAIGLWHSRNKPKECEEVEDWV